MPVSKACFLSQPEILIKFQVPMQGPYDQFLLFGDSITQQSFDQAEGFAFGPALQNGMNTFFSFPHQEHHYETCTIAYVIYQTLIVNRAC